MSTFVYILQSTKSGKYYIGSAGNVARRLIEHNSGKTKSLKNHLPLILKFAQEFDERRDALRIEKKLKKWKNREILGKIIADKIISSESGPMV